MTKIDGKVSQIEFHINHYEIDDFIVRAAELIKEGYHICSYRGDSIDMCANTLNLEPKLHITLQKIGVY